MKSLFCSGRNIKCRRSHNVQRGFTLIELLVVIAIISILASMLFPAFSRAREQARKVVCISNLRQISLGVMQYTQDYDEGFPVGYPFWEPSKPPRSQLLVGVLDPYIKSDQIWSCPSWKGKASANPTYLGNYSFLTGTDTSGSPNNVIGVPLPPPATLAPAALAALGKPTEYPLLFCGVAPQQTEGDTPGKTGDGLMAVHAGITDRGWTNGELGGDTILYGDGHAKYLPLTRGKWDTIYTTPRGG